MASPNEVKWENQILRDRISKLTAASLRISASLDLDTVLSEVVESARALTGARFGVITTIGEAGQAEDFVSSGFTPDEHRQIVEWDEGPRLFQHFRDFEGVLRVSDIPGYVRSLGFSPPPILPKTIQGTGMRHRGVNIGNFFLAGKSGGQEFTKEDEEVLVLFAAQAATAIANARTYRDEHRTRADLEALVDTSPVGVAVFDARTGQPVLLNREARRIVEGLVVPGQSAEQLLEVMKCRRADGREISLEKLPLAQLLSSATTVRAEEIVLEVPGGRSVTTLINATPIHSQDGVVESVVVTLQDMAPLEEMERSRAEFLSLVSHELRAPLSSIKGSAATVRDASPAPDLAEILQFFRIIEEQADHMRGLISDLLDAGRIEAGSLSVTPEPAQVADLVDQARTTFLSGGDRHTLLIDLPPDLPRVRGWIRGSGLGLICLRFGPKPTGGASGPRSGAGLGARFTFTIPVAEETGNRAAAVAAGSSSRPPREGRKRPHILVVDDDPLTLRFVRDALSAAGYSPLVTGDPHVVPHLIKTKKPQLVLLDLMLPGTDGIELMESLPELADLPVIFISGYGRDDTIAKALRKGAVDYIVKPFSPTELVARIQAVLRRFTQPSEPFRLGDLAIDYEGCRVTVAGRPVELTATEYELLSVLSVNAGRVMTYDSLLRSVWGDRDAGDSPLLQNYVKRIRRKLGDDATHPSYIFTLRQVGYRMARPSDR